MMDMTSFKLFEPRRRHVRFAVLLSRTVFTGFVIKGV